jgi:RimJ/RimL family protein N-acetyltransferase
MTDPAQAGTVVARWAAGNADDPRYGIWAVEVRDTGAVAGTVLLKPLPDGDGEVEVGWHLHPDSWGHGYATEAARGAVERGFAAGLPEVYAVVRPDNARSIAVCRRLGMAPLGRTTRWYGVEVAAFRLTASGTMGG